jgi:hypothetical protein
VVRTDVFRVKQLEVGTPRRASDERLERADEVARKTEALDEVHGLQGLPVELIAHGDGLQQHTASTVSIDISTSNRPVRLRSSRAARRCDLEVPRG